MVDKREKGGFVYVMSNWTGDVIYTGITNSLERRVWEHKNKAASGFTAKYNLSKLVFYEEFGDIESAIFREKEIKKWRREKKNKIIEAMNPEWEDLSEGWYEDSSIRCADVRNDGIGGS